MEVSINQEMIDITGALEDNPNWVYICECGNRISADNKPRMKFTHFHIDREGDLMPKYSWHCKQCWHHVSNEEMRGSVRFSVARKYTPGRTNWHIILTTHCLLEEGECSITIQWNDKILVGLGYIKMENVRATVGEMILCDYSITGLGGPKYYSPKTLRLNKM